MPLVIPLPGEHNIYHALAAAAVGNIFGMDIKDIVSGIEDTKSVVGRTNFLNMKDGITVIDDCYNASPASVKSALSLLSSVDGRKIAVLGDMGELGKDEVEIHKQLGENLYSLGYNIMLTVGDLSRNISDVDTSRSIHYMTIEGCAYYLKNNLKKGDWVLIKASRAMGLEKIIDILKKYEEKTK